MGEKVYKPIVKDGDHLVHSKDNPERVRGLTRDANNQNPDIIEWEEYDIDDLQNDNCAPYHYEEQHVQLTPEQEEVAQLVGKALSALIVSGGILLFREVISPWWKNKARPWIKEKTHRSDKKKQKAATIAKKTNKNNTEPNIQLANVTEQIDKAFESAYIEMDEEEVKAHMMKLIYHMLGMANEIRIIINAQIKADCESEEQYIECQKELEKFLSERVAYNLDQLLSRNDLQLDLDTSRKLSSLTGGGVYLNGVYVPVQAIKINEALMLFPVN